MSDYLISERFIHYKNGKRLECTFKAYFFRLSESKGTSIEPMAEATKA
jgi:hypothetical protein